jgi:SAM-dependent methyltransferase
MKKDADTFGRVLVAQLEGRDSGYLVERSDGYMDWDSGAHYFGPDRDRGMRRALKMARGKVLDIGCGAGRHSLALQRRGLRVTGIDRSPLAVRVCRRRGVKDARVLGIEQIGRLPAGSFDTVVMFGNNFGLFGSPARARGLLREMRRITPPGARILAQSLDVHRTTNPEHLSYQRRNRARGRLSGQLRLRIRFGLRAGPWFDYLMVSPAEMRGVLRGTGWRLDRVLPSGGPLYVGVISRRG